MSSVKKKWKDGDASEFWFRSRCWLPESRSVDSSETSHASWFGLRKTRWAHPPRHASGICQKAKRAAVEKHEAAEEESKAKAERPKKKRRKTEAGEEGSPAETKCRKWRNHPNAGQRATFRLWFAATNAIYNRAAKMINSDKKNARMKTLRGAITNAEACGGPMRSVPYEIRDSPLRDLVKACKALRAKEKRLKRKFKLREKEADTRSFAIRARQLNCKNARGDVWPRLFGTVRDRTAMMRTEDGKTLPLVFEHDCRLLWETKTGFYYLCFPVDVEKKSEEGEKKKKKKKKEIVTIDPGVRTFATCYDAYGGRVTEWGCSHTTKIVYWLIRKASRLEEKARLAKGRHRRRIRAVAARMRKRFTDLVNELHRKLSLWLCERFSVVILPKFSPKEMVQRRNRTDGRQDAEDREEDGWRYGASLPLQVQDVPAAQGEGERDRRRALRRAPHEPDVRRVRDGTLNAKLGSSKTFRCPRCAYEADRDHNAARNILVRYVWKQGSES